MSQYPQDPQDPLDTSRSDLSDAVASESEPYTTGGIGGSSAVGQTDTTTYPTETYTTESSRTDQAREQGRQVADTAKEQAAGVAGTAKQEAGNVAQEAKSQARNLVGEARSTLRGQAQGQTQQVAGFVGGLADNLQALTEGRTDEAGAIGQYAQQASDQVRQLAQRVDERGFDGLVQDVQRFARRQPVTFLIGAGVAGFVVGRLVRGARDAASDDSGSSGGYAGTGPTYATPTTGYATDVDYRPATDYGTSPYDTTGTTTGYGTAVGTGAETSLPVAGDPVYGGDAYDTDTGDRR